MPLWKSLGRSSSLNAKLLLRKLEQLLWKLCTLHDLAFALIETGLLQARGVAPTTDSSKGLLRDEHQRSLGP